MAMNVYLVLQENCLHLKGNHWNCWDHFLHHQNIPPRFPLPQDRCHPSKPSPKLDRCWLFANVNRPRSKERELKVEYFGIKDSWLCVYRAHNCWIVFLLLQFHTRKNCLCRGGKTKFVSEGVEFDPTDRKRVKVALNLGYQNPCFCKGLMSECLRIAQGLFFLPCIRDTHGHHGPQGDRWVPLGKSCLCWSTLELFSPLFPGGLAVKILLKYSVWGTFLVFLWRCPESTSTLFWRSTERQTVRVKIDAVRVNQ